MVIGSLFLTKPIKNRIVIFISFFHNLYMQLNNLTTYCLMICLLLTGFNYSISQFSNNEREPIGISDTVSENTIAHDCCEDDQNNMNCADHCLSIFSACILFNQPIITNFYKRQLYESIQIVFPINKSTSLYRPPIA